MKIASLVRPVVAQLKPYQPAVCAEQLSKELNIPVKKLIKLDIGENLVVSGALPSVRVQDRDLIYYPDPAANALRQALSTYTNFAPNYLICGNGSDELIDLLIRCFVDSGEEIIICPPTFSLYSLYGQLAQATVSEVLRKPSLKIDAARILKQVTKRTKIIFIDSPGNPAGILVSNTDIRKLCQANCLVVIDEAYYEYAGKTVAPLVKKYPNLVILRTLSKWAGLAGLRIGYAIANPDTINILSSVKSPYNVNTIAQKVATQVITSPQPILQAVEKIAKLRDETIKKLQLFDNIKVYTSKSAFIVFKLQDNQTAQLYTYLRQQGIIGKLINQPVLGECLRVTVGTRDEMDKFLSTLKRWPSSERLKKYDAVIFDMDGVLVDVAQSYLKAIELTVNQIIGKKRITQTDVAVIKKIVGFNNDWDASYALVKLNKQNIPREVWTTEAKRLLPINQKSRFYKKIYETFQTYYLGSRLFEQQTKRAAPFRYAPGLITKEKKLIDDSLLSDLTTAGYTIAIATGRPSFEAKAAIKQANLTPFFTEKNVVTLEDTIQGKPAPDPLLLAKKMIRAKNPVYVGDSTNDIMASQRAKMDCISIGIRGGTTEIVDVNKLRKELM